MESVTLLIFTAALVACVSLDVSILWALAFGLALFLMHGRRRGLSWQRLAGLCMEGVSTVRNILLTFVLIGLMTAMWRAAGTIPVIVGCTVHLVRPRVFLPMCFLLNCAVSMLTGTAFGTSATMGVICATMGRSMGVDIRMIGGAVIAGSYFGDRCSPLSSSALLVSELTHTDHYANIRNMLRSGLVPFLGACAAYLLVGLNAAGSGRAPDLQALFGRAFNMHPIAILPAAVVLVMSAFRVRVRWSMLASILTAIPLCLWVQGMPAGEALRCMLLGYRAGDAEIAAMLNGGGVFSMARVAGIVCISSAYSGLFRETGMLDGAHRALRTLAARTNRFTAVFVTSALACMIACNQTLSVMLTNQLCGDLGADSPTFANALEDTVIVMAPLVPWSIAYAVSAASTGAPPSCLAFAFFLYGLPLYRLAGSLVRTARTRTA